VVRVTITDEQLTDLIGPVGIDEYKAASDSARAKLDAWIGALRGLSDDELYTECRRWIYEGALVQRFQRMNFEDVHCRGTACFFESRRRARLTGHEDHCAGPTIYSRAYAAVTADAGYPGMGRIGTCDCTTDSSDPGLSGGTPR
jgi:hypothetical protein